MSLVPIFVPLVLHTGRPILGSAAAATAIMLVVGHSADPVLIGMAAMIIIEGSSALLALILPAMAPAAHAPRTPCRGRAP
jgi:hypothetical protein